MIIVDWCCIENKKENWWIFFVNLQLENSGLLFSIWDVFGSSYNDAWDIG